MWLARIQDTKGNWSNEYSLDDKPVSPEQVRQAVNQKKAEVSYKLEMPGNIISTDL